MSWTLFGLIGIPLLFGVAFAFFRIATIATIPTWGIPLDIALDLSILGIGVSITSMDLPIMRSFYQENLWRVGTALIGTSLLFAFLILSVNRHLLTKSRQKFWVALIALILGCAPLLGVGGALLHANRARTMTGPPEAVLIGALLSSSIAISLILCWLSQLFINSVPRIKQVANDPVLLESVARAILDFDPEATVPLDDFVVGIARKKRIFER